MSRIFPDPYGAQIRQALEQGLRGIAKVAQFAAEFFVGASAQAEFTKSFGPTTEQVTVIAPTPKTASFVASAPVVELTQDVIFSKTFVAVGTIGTSTTTTKTPVFTPLAEVFQV
jgi:hypothetical protein